jgi:two-component system chemotaxis response regulator CheB
MPSRQIRVLVVDESVLSRFAMERALAGAEDVALLGLSPNGRTGLAKVVQQKPEVVVLSCTLPDLSAAQFVREAVEAQPSLAVVVTAAEAALPSDAVDLALAAGAVEVVAKPEARSEEEGIEILARRLVPRIRSSSTAAYSRIAKHRSGRELVPPPEGRRELAPARAGRPRRGIELVVIGGSAGGPDALTAVVRELPEEFPVPILAAIHMPGLFTGALAQALDSRSALAVVEARDGQLALPGTVYLAPGERHLTVRRDSFGRLVVRTRDQPPVDGHRPSVDLLFGSAAKIGPRSVLAVILTGMGNDGTEGLGELKQAQATVLAQDEASSVVWGMPGSAVRAGVVDEVLPLGEIPARLRRKVDR